MPELSMDAPSLDSIGSRLNAPWMARWINNPKAMRAAALMPQIFHDAKVGDDQIDPRARDIAAYLATQNSTAVPDANIPDNAAAGAHLFTSLGCVACHTAPGIDPDPTGKRITLKFVKDKLHPAALVAFLKQPEAHYAWIRMPNFHLSDDEATKLASFLIGTATADAMPATDMTGADSARGKTLFESSGCVNCHAPTGKSGLTTVKSLADVMKSDWSHGCMAADDAARGDAPELFV